MTPEQLDQTMDLYRELTRCGIAWAVADRLADQAADELNDVEKRLAEARACADRCPSLEAVDIVARIGIDAGIHRDKLAAACEREAAAERDYKRAAKRALKHLEGEPPSVVVCAACADQSCAGHAS